MNGRITTAPTPRCGVGVLDKVDLIIRALEAGPATLAVLVEVTGLARPTVHRLLLALERLGWLGRDAEAFTLAPRPDRLERDRLARHATTPLRHLRRTTRLNVALYERRERAAFCVLDLPWGWVSPHQRVVPLDAGPIGLALRAWQAPEDPGESPGVGGPHADIREFGWARDGTAAVAAPVRDATGRVAAAVLIAGPSALLATLAADRHRQALVQAAAAVSAMVPPAVTAPLGTPAPGRPTTSSPAWGTEHRPSPRVTGPRSREAGEERVRTRQQQHAMTKGTR